MALRSHSSSYSFLSGTSRDRLGLTQHCFRGQAPSLHSSPSIPYLHIKGWASFLASITANAPLHSGGSPHPRLHLLLPLFPALLFLEPLYQSRVLSEESLQRCVGKVPRPSRRGRTQGLVMTSREQPLAGRSEGKQLYWRLERAEVVERELPWDS